MSGNKKRVNLEKRSYGSLPLDCQGEILHFSYEVDVYLAIITGSVGMWGYIKKINKKCVENIRFPLVLLPEKPLDHVKVIGKVDDYLMYKYPNLTELLFEISPLFPEIRELVIDGHPKDSATNRVTKIEHLSSTFPRLKALTIKHFDKNLEFGENSFPNLEILSLESGSYGSDTVYQTLKIEYTKYFPNLKELEIINFSINLQNFKICELVDTIKMTGTYFAHTNLRILMGRIRKQIRVLHFNEMEIFYNWRNFETEVRTYDLISGFPNLEELMCKDDHKLLFDRQDFENLDYYHYQSTFVILNCPKLRTISIHGALTSFMIEGCPLVEDIEFMYCGRVEMRYLADAYHLKRICIQNSRVGTGLWNYLYKMKSLQTVTIHDELWGYKGMYGIRKYKPLELNRFRDLSVLVISSKRNILLVKSMKHMKKLKVVEVKWVGKKVVARNASEKVWNV